MSGWEKLGKALGSLATGAAVNLEAQRLVGLGRSQARREIKSHANSWGSDGMRDLVFQLDFIAKALSSSDRENADLAAELAEYAESFI